MAYMKYLYLFVEDADIIGPEDLRDRFGWMAIPFKLDLGSCLPPTIRLKPTRSITKDWH